MFSIITPSFNQGAYLEDTIVSVISQDYKNFEYIVIDGGSTDESFEIIKKYRKNLKYWISEKDKGQTHAINKGLKIAKGKIINWLNSDDTLCPFALKHISNCYNDNKDAGIFYGDFGIIDSKGNYLFEKKTSPYLFQSLLYGRQLSCQPAVFFTKQVLTNIGYLDENLNFCMDQDFWIRAGFNKVKFKQIKEVLAKARIHKNSKTSRLQKELHNEHKKILHKYKKIPFPIDSFNGEIYYILLNRIWRFFNYINKVVSRKDLSLLRVTLFSRKVR